LLSENKFPWLRSKMWKIIEQGNWASQPNIISISPYVRERLSGIATGMIYDIENPISESFFDIDRAEKKGVIFSSAVISPRKNTWGLVKAVSKLVAEGVDVQLRLAGSVVNQEYADQMNQWIEDHDMKEHVHFLGKISVDDIKNELSQAAIYALVSLEENSPMGIEEAMAVGVPVVTSNCCGMPYMVRHSETGFLVDPFNSQSIADKFRYLLDCDSLRKQQGENGSRIAIAHYHPKVVAKRTRDVYVEIVQSWYIKNA